MDCAAECSDYAALLDALASTAPSDAAFNAAAAVASCEAHCARYLKACPEGCSIELVAPPLHGVLKADGRLVKDGFPGIVETCTHFLRKGQLGALAPPSERAALFEKCAAGWVDNVIPLRVEKKPPTIPLSLAERSELRERGHAPPIVSAAITFLALPVLLMVIFARRTAPVLARARGVRALERRGRERTPGGDVIIRGLVGEVQGDQFTLDIKPNESIVVHAGTSAMPSPSTTIYVLGALEARAEPAGYREQVEQELVLSPPISWSPTPFVTRRALLFATLWLAVPALLAARLLGGYTTRATRGYAVDATWALEGGSVKLNGTRTAPLSADWRGRLDDVPRESRLPCVAVDGAVVQLGAYATVEWWRLALAAAVAAGAAFRRRESAVRGRGKYSV